MRWIDRDVDEEQIRTELPNSSSVKNYSSYCSVQKSIDLEIQLQPLIQSN